MSGVLGGNCCATCRNIPQKITYEGVYPEEFFNKIDDFSERLQQLLIKKKKKKKRIENNI